MFRTSLFAPKLEFINLVVPVLFVAGMLGELIFFGSLFGKIDSLTTILIRNMIFLHMTHIILTYVMLVTLPEMKLWVKQTSGGRPLLFWIKIGAIFFLLNLIFIFASLKESLFFPVANFINGYFLFIFPFHHTVFQFKGLSFAYNQRIRADYKIEKSDRLQIRSEKLESFGFYLIFASLLIIRILSLKEPFISNYEFNYFDLRKLAYAGSFLGIFMVFAGALSFPFSGRSNKSGYLLRILSLPFSHTSLFAGFAVSFSHGFEYLCVYLKMNSGSRFQLAKQRKFAVYLGLLLLVFGLSYGLSEVLDRWYFSGAAEKPVWVVILQTFFVTTAFVHYYLDRIIFRMRDKQTREIVAPLIT